MRIDSFTDLKVWRLAMDLAVDVYDVTSSYPTRELYVLSAATRKTTISIPSNIAEGFCRRSTQSYLNHLNIAMGSEGELTTQLMLGGRLGFVSDARLKPTLERVSEVGRMLHGLSGALERRVGSEPRSRS